MSAAHTRESDRRTASEPGAGRAEAVLSIRDLVVEFTTPAGTVRAVDSVGYNVGRAETLGVVGETGSGKSVTVLSALGLLRAPNLRKVTGQVLLDGESLLDLPDRELRRRLGRDVAMIFQDPISALNPVQRVGHQIAEGIRVHDPGVSAKAARARVVELLGKVGVPHPEARFDQYPHQFSGGMCQRAVIAMAIANRPKVLIADEPTTALDVSVQAQILELLRVAADETGAATVLITHDLGVVAETADRVCVMYAGRVVETAGVEQIFAQPRHPYTASLLNSLPRLDMPAGRLTPIPGQPPDLVDAAPGCAFAPRCPIGRDRAVCHERRPELLPADLAGPDGQASPGSGPASFSACHFPAEAAGLVGAGDSGSPGRPAVTDGASSATADDASHETTDDAPHEATEDASDRPVLRITEVVKRFPVRSGVFARPSAWVHAVDGVSLRIRPGQTLGLVGESGCGKSTLARLLLRLHEASSGEIVVDGDDVGRAGKAELRRIRRRVQMVFQDPYASLNPRLTVGDNVAEPLRLDGGFSRAARRRRVLELFGRVGLRPEHADRFPSEFSGGQRQRVAIARALALEPRLLILDEPVSALDVSVQAQVLNLLDDLQRESGMAYLFVSHDLSVVRQVADEVAVMYLGTVVESGPVERVYADPRHPYTRALLASVPVPDPAGRDRRRRTPLGGDVPSPSDPPSGCRFRTRCPLAEQRCADEEPPLRPTAGGRTACHFAEDTHHLRQPAVRP
ncbi:ABC transporter ATP-binding protein [Phytoactinopolyspora halotolerans]|uniref:ABC transporter ATP-binding protein n=1 Tax=Phytoactinopolyspora halotolerans TaxID=1981512 RepID=A0A6L9S7X2_9ACTN|nr:ABC transporter ATP-binding protein [Phytoactinopolyspora halotolerans]NEE01565.1 ABC transporter ATP-binding protein [Phytoactinopolyspora halotolerans]